MQYSDALCPNDLDNLLPDNGKDVVTSLIDELEYTGPSVPLRDPPEWGNDVFDLGGNSEFDRVPGDTGPEIIDPIPGNDIDDLVLSSNTTENRKVRWWMEKYGLDPKYLKELKSRIHHWITKQRMSDDEVEVEVAEFAREKKEREERKNRGR